LALIAVVLVLLILFVFKIKVKGKVEELDHKIISTKNELKELEKSEVKIEELKVSELIFQRKIDVIKKLEQRKTGPVYMLDEIALRIPGEMWVTQLKSQGALLTLDGISIDNETIAQFMTNLENSGQFENVELKFAQETKNEDYILKKFSVTAILKVMKEVEEEKPEEADRDRANKKKKKK
ncbi:MAG: PilN domain-containing protein, partial [Deltaproteobacteria bacterium]|nr:PilN domain-containing protein [Deltaproteobacteria bacterium]